MINVMMLINSFNLGGAEKLVYDLARNMKDRENVRVFVCAMKNVETELEKTLKTQLENENILCFSIAKKYKGDRIRTILKIRKLIKENRINILHTHGQSPDFYGRIATIGTSTKTVVTIHSTAGYSRNVEKILNTFTSRYVAVSNETQRYCKDELDIKKEVCVIENGIDIQRYEKVNEPSKEFVVLSVGRIDEKKGYLEIVAKIAPFLRRHQDAVWKIFGSYNKQSKYFEKLQNAITSSEVAAQIQLNGTTIYPEIEYRNANCFLLNSKCEGFGIAYIEAMAAQIPVLGNCVGVIQDVMRNGGSIGLISKINLEEYLEQIYIDRHFNQHAVQINKVIVEQMYSIAISVKKYLSIYEQVIGE